MKLKCCGTILSVLLAAVLATGCTNPGENEITSESSVQDEVSDSSSNSAENPPESAKPIISEKLIVSSGNPNFSSLDITAETLFPVSQASEKSILSVNYTDTAANILLTDLSNGETCSMEYSADPSQYNFYLVNGYPLSVNYQESTVTVYDKNLKQLGTETLDCSDFVCSCFGNTLAITDNSPRKSIIIAEIGDDGALSRREIKVAAGDSWELSTVLGKVREGEYLLSYFDNADFNMRYGILYENSGEVVVLDTSEKEYAVLVGGNIIIADIESAQTDIFNPDYPDIKKVLEPPQGSSIISSPCDNENLYYYTFIPSENPEKTTVKFYRYSVESGQLTAELETDVDNGCTSFLLAYEYGDYVLLQSLSYDGIKTMVWKPEETDTQSGYNAVSGNDYSIPNSELAKKIKDKYSTDVLYGNNAVRFFTGYAVVSETDEKLINDALIKLDTFMSKFPEGFFDEMIGNSAEYNEMCIYLTGKIVPDLNESQSISDAAAFVTTEDNRHIMVVDITNSDLEATIAHEYMHIIENAMFSIAANKDWNGAECFMRWEMLNPDGFSYYYSYTDENGVTLGSDAVDYNGALYYDGCGIDINSFYFVDGYAMTYPTEDRARIFENIATYSESQLPAYFKGRAMQLKAAYLSACIRSTFDCITDDTVLFWENAIDPELTLDYFQKNYDYNSYIEGAARG